MQLRHTKSGIEVKVKTSTKKNTRPVGLLLRSDDSVVKAATYKTHSENERRISLPSVGFKPANPAIKRP
jgi:hypothetical protein